MSGIQPTEIETIQNSQSSQNSENNHEHTPCTPLDEQDMLDDIPTERLRKLIVDYAKLRAQAKILPDFFSPLVQSGEYLDRVLNGFFFATEESNPVQFPLQRAPVDFQLKRHLLNSILMSTKENEGGQNYGLFAGMSDTQFMIKLLA